jgi:N-methylhydantoinase A
LADIGGTTFDVGLIVDGQPITKATNVIERHEYRIRNLDVESIGSGGGSITWVDEEYDRLRVGPESAGADPGPACYGNGGDAFTVTDAALLRGSLDPTGFLGGRSSLDVDAAEAAAERLADALGIGRVEVVYGVSEIATEQMADHLRRRTLGRGYDPRQFVVYAYGGAGPLYVPAVAHRVGIDEVVVPAGDLASVWSAVGISAADVLHRNETSHVKMSVPFDAQRLTTEFNRLERAVRTSLRDEGFRPDEIDLQRYASLKYGKQVHELGVQVPVGELTDAQMDALVDRFERRYEQRYGGEAARPTPVSSWSRSGSTAMAKRLTHPWGQRRPTDWGRATRATTVIARRVWTTPQ